MPDTNPSEITVNNAELASNGVQRLLANKIKNNIKDSVTKFVCK